MIEIYKKEYSRLSISKVITSIKKFNKQGVLSKKAKIVSIENYHPNGDLTEKKEYYSDEKSIKNNYIFDSSSKTLKKEHFFLDGKIEYENVWQYDNHERLMKEGKYHYNYSNSLGKPVLGRNWKGEYDSIGNLLSSIQYSHCEEVEESYSYKYNNEGKLIEKNADNYKWSYVYNNVGLLQEIIRIESFFKDKVDYAWFLEYNENNQLIKKTRYLNDEIDYIQKWKYENGNKIKEIECLKEETILIEYSTLFEYNANNQILKEVGESIIRNYYYDDNNLLIEESNIDFDGRVLSRLIYSRNDAGLIISSQENIKDDVPKQILIYDYEYLQ
jgi:hypothetical protein